MFGKRAARKTNTIRRRPFTRLHLEELERRLAPAVVDNQMYLETLPDGRTVPVTHDLYWALGEARKTPGTTITFNLAPGEVLPSPTTYVVPKNTVIDGTDANGMPTVVLDFAQAPLLQDGIEVLGGNSIVKGLDLISTRRTQLGAAIAIDGFRNRGLTTATGGNTIQDCYIGVDLTGQSAPNPNAFVEGIYILNSVNNVIGGGIAGRNVISGNSVGILVNDNVFSTRADNSSQVQGQNTIQANYIGTSADGTTAIPNQVGVFVEATADSAGFPTSQVYITDNVVSGNSIAGIAIEGQSTGNYMQGNKIGTNAGTGPLLDGSGNPVVQPAGVLIDASNGLAFVIGAPVGIPATNYIQSKNIISGNQVGIQILGGASRNVVQDNYIGTDSSGLTRRANGTGIDVQSVGTQILRNVISANTNAGLLIHGSATGTLVQSNLIGTDPTGTTTDPNHGGALGNKIGVRIIRATGTTLDGNVIGGNGTGVVVDGSDGPLTATVLQGNYLGTDTTRAVNLGNQTGLAVNNVVIPVNAPSPLIFQSQNVIMDNSLFGIALVGNTSGFTVTTLVIQQNDTGVLIDNATGNTITSEDLVNNDTGVWIRNKATGNRVAGCHIYFTKSLGPPPGDSPNSQEGVFLDNVYGNSVGGAQQGNTIAGNYIGVLIAGQIATGNFVQGNTIGPDNPRGATANNQGVWVQGSINVIGGDATQGLGNTIFGNVDGVRITTGDPFGNSIQTAMGNFIEGNKIGLDSTGAVGGNDSAGVVISGAGSAGNLVGVLLPSGDGGNTITYNKIGVWLEAGASGNKLDRNLIGTTDGSTAGPNGTGVLVEGPGNFIGLPHSGGQRANVISGNTSGNSIGVLINGADGNYVQANLIGLTMGSAGGTASSLANGTGVVIDNAANNIIGGDAPGTGNLIGGNLADGIVIQNGAAQQNTVSRNTIGFQRAPNGRNGIFIVDAPNNIIGSSLASDRNNIADNVGDGVFIEGARANDNAVLGNTVVRNANGVEIVGVNAARVAGNTIDSNKSDGVKIDAGATGVLIGPGNTITNNTGYGVNVQNTTQAPFLQPPNTIENNQAGQIHEGFLVSGTLINLTFWDGSTIEGTLVGTPNTPFELDAYSSSTLDPSGGAQAEAFVGATTVTTDATGAAYFKVDFATSVELGQFITTTVTGPHGTSGYSPPVIVIPPPAPDELSIGDVALRDGSSGTTAFQFTVRRMNATAPVVTVQVDTADGTATAAGGDYLPVSGLVLTFGPGVLSQTVTINVPGNTTADDDETFTVNLSNAVGGTIGKGVAVATILNDDQGQFSVSDVAAPRNPGVSVLGTAFGFTVSLTKPSDAPVSVQVDTADGTARASRGDYTPISGLVLTFNPGAPLTQTVVVYVSNTSDVRTDQTFRVNLSHATRPGVSITKGTGLGTILFAPPSFSVNNLALPVESNGVTFAFTVTLSNPGPDPVSVQVDTADTASGNDGDYTPVSGLVLTFLPGAPLTQTVLVNVDGTTTAEPDESFNVILSHATGPRASIIDAVGLGTIRNDVPAAFSINDVALPDGAGGTSPFAFTVSMSNPSTHPVSVKVDTADGTASAAAGDYTPISGLVLTFIPGAPLTQTVIVNVAGSAIVEPDKTFSVNLSHPTGFAASLARPTGTGTILNDDTAALSINDVTLPEGDSGLTPFPFTLSLSKPSALPIAVQVDTADGTASAADNDYQPISGLVLTFNPGDPLTKIVTVNGIGDQLPEPDETFAVKLSHLTFGGAASPNVSFARSIGLGTLHDLQPANVATLPNAVDGRLVTLVSPPGTSLENVVAQPNPNPNTAPPGMSFPVGFFGFTLAGLTAGAAATVTVFPPPGVTADQVYSFGRLSLFDLNPFYYPFSFDGTTGAEIQADGSILLHLVDHGRGDNDLTSNGLISATLGPARVTGTDLALTNTTPPSPVEENQPMTYTLAVHNQGTNNATGVTLSDTLPAGVTLVSVAAGQGTFTQNNGIITFNLGDLANGASATATIVVTTPSGPGLLTNTAGVTCNEGDLSPNDDTVSVDTVVEPVGIISGQKFLDLNGNGVHDPGEPGVNGVTIQLVDPATGAVLMTTQTHSVDLNGDGVIDPQTEMGLYSFRVQVAGTYQVREVSPAGSTQTSPLGLATTRVSVSTTSVQANNASAHASMSADGRFIAFDSRASNLVSGDTNGASDVFVYDRQTGLIERDSVPDPSMGQAQANGTSDFPSISADGRYVAFQSFASNLVPGDTNHQPDIFVHDRVTGATERVSVSSSGVQGNGPSGPAPDFVGRGPSISADGRFVAFESAADNLVPGDTNGAVDVFVRDRLTGTTQIVSVNNAGQGTLAGQVSDSPSISADGQFVAFESVGTNLVPNDTNNVEDIFVYDRQSSTIQRASTDSLGGQAIGPSNNPRISADGHYVTFQSDATNLVAGDTNGTTDVFVKNLATGQTERVSVPDPSLGPAQANGASGNPALSADGRYVAFQSFASNLVAGDTNNSPDIFVHDRQTGLTTRSSVDSAGNQAAGASSSDLPAISADGQTVAFQSSAANLVPGDTNNAVDIFVRNPSGVGVHTVSIALRQTVTGQDFGNLPTASDVAVALAGPVGPVLAGTEVTYTINFRNLGPLAAQNTQLLDTLPAGLAFVSASGGGVFNPQTDTVTFALGTLAANDAGGVTVTALVTAPGGSLTDTAAISTPTAESDLTNDSASVTNPAVSADVNVALVGPVGPVTAGTDITYTLNYRNLGTAAAQNTQLVDLLPAGLAFVSASGGGIFDPQTGTVTYALGTLAVNDGAPGGPDEGSVTVTALVTALSGSLTDTATISTTTVESDLTNNSSMVTNPAVSADVTVALGGPAGPVVAGTNTTYTLNFRNLGTAPAENIQLVDALPAGLAFVSASGGGIFDPQADTVTFALGTLAANDGMPGGPDEGSVTLTALVTATGGSLTDTATISTSTLESDLTNNSASVANAVVSADVAVALAGPVGPVTAGTDISYTLNYRNLGTAAAQNTQLVDFLPAGLAFVSASGGGTFDPLTNTVTFALGTLAANDGSPGGGGPGSVTVTALVTALGGSVIDAASITTTTVESDLTNNNSMVINPAVSADVTVALAGPVGPVLTGTDIAYTLNCRNLGMAAAEATQMVDTLPAGLAFVSASGGGVFDPQTGTVTFALGTLAANDGAPGGPDEGSVTVTALVTATGASVNNTAAISTTTVESDLTNNTSMLTNPVVAADVTVALAGPVGPVVAGTQITYTLNYRNLGTGAAQNTQLVNALPRGLVFVGASGGGRFNGLTRQVSSALGTLAANDGSPGGPDEGSVTVTALVTATGGSVTDTATISTTTLETDLTNNSASATNPVIAANVTVALAGSPNPVVTGADIVYTLNYRNLGTAAAQNVQLLDTLPAGAAFVSASGGGVFDAQTNTVTFALATLAANDGAPGGPDEGSVTVTALVTATGGSLTDLATISTTSVESDLTNNTDRVTTPVAAADVAVALFSPLQPVPAGTHLNYNLVYRNFGALDAQQTQLVDALPAGLTFLSATGGGTFNAQKQQVTFALATLPADDGSLGGGGQGIATVTVLVNALSGSLVDTASISTTTVESDLTNDTSMVTNPAVSADVTVALAGPVGQVLAGTNITYTLNYRNLGTAAAQATQLVDTLPAGLAFVSASGGGRFDPLTGQVTFALGTLAANDGAPGGPDEGSVTVTARVTATSGAVTNTADISTTTAESDASNNHSTLTNTVIQKMVCSASDSFIGALYQDLLGRPAEAGALAAWSSQMDQGMSRAQLVQIIEGSLEYRTRLVEGLYTTLLHRLADPGGRAGFVSFLGQGGTVEQVKAMLIGSPEYFQTRGGGNTCGFLDALYRDVLGRPVDAAGLAAWTPAMTFFSPTTVADLVLSSSEAHQRLVASCYQLELHRPAPAGEGNPFVAYLDKGVQILASKQLLLGDDKSFDPVLRTTGQFQLMIFFIGSEEYASNAVKDAGCPAPASVGDGLGSA